MKIERGYAQHVGSRNEQQDAGLVLTDEGRAEQLVLVADGMGGHAGGATASRMAVQAIETRMRAAREASPELFAPEGTLEESAIPEFLREACQVKNIWVPYGE